MLSPQSFIYAITGLLGLLASGAAARSAEHLNVQVDLSFGHDGHHVWTDDHRHVTGWTMDGDQYGHHPELLSDRVILTPPWPGNKRASAWADWPEMDEHWTVNSEFRVSGPEHASANFNIWYVSDKHLVESSSIYTVGKFDGLAIVMDQYHHGGSIRGFLNDGTISYKDHHHVDSLPFGHCTYSFRNTGQWANLELRQTEHDFEVLVDGHRCFQTKKVKVHPGHYFGLTAASSEPPDSIEVKNFIVKGPAHNAHDPSHDATDHAHHAADYYNPSHYQSASHHDPVHHDAIHGAPPPKYEHHEHHKDSRDQYDGKDWYWVDEKEHIKDHESGYYNNEKERFGDLHDRMQLLNHQMDLLYHDFSVFKDTAEDKQRELTSWLAPIHEYVSINKVMLERMEATIEELKSQVSGKEFKEHLEGLSHLVAESHATLMAGIPNSVHSMVSSNSPRFGFFVFVIVASQVMLLGSYIVYRRRQDAAPKKYL
ncbi:concanavalin A-like lectin/glucanase [Microthyrium microscopicum]|uniref:Concanavalin A-like lectin/glucanase n=1 Tax=Microthyrium microscopicum TaxID=703497 RepID=A0A6A6TZY0_9PEZI|nr:concanavalin A-like lectin/glucanase [Microthyrium microscopicum]